MRKTTKRRIGGAAAGLILVTITLVLALRIYDYPYAASELPSAIKQATEAGVPLVSTELERAATHEAPTNTVGLFAMFDVNGSMVSVSNLYPSFLGIDEIDPEATLQIEANKKVLDEICRVSSLSRPWERPDWDNSPNLKLDFYQQARGACRALCARALIACQGGRLDDAIADLVCVRSMSQHCSDGGVLSLLTQLSLDALLRRTLESCFARLLSKPDEIVRLRNTMLSAEPAYDLKAMVRHEAFSLVTTSRNLDLFGGMQSLSIGTPVKVDPKKLARQGSPTGLVPRAFLARSLQYSAACLKALERHLDDPIAACREMDRISAREGDSQRGMSRQLVKLMAPRYEEVGKSIVASLAEYRCLRTLSFVLESKGRSGSFPGSLAAAKAEVLDPFDGKPLRYTRKDKEIRVWSVGRDGRENGGITQREAFRSSAGSRATPFDIVSMYPPVRPARRGGGGQAAAVN